MVNVPREEAAVTFRVTDLMVEAVAVGAAKRKPKDKPRKPLRKDCTACTDCSICSICSICSRCSLCTQTAPPSTCSPSDNGGCSECAEGLDRNLTTLRKELQARIAGDKAA